MTTKWRCITKAEWGRIGYRCVFVPLTVGAPVSEEFSNEQVAINGNVDVTADDDYAAILAPIKVRTLYDSLPDFSKPAPTLTP